MIFTRRSRQPAGTSPNPGHVWTGCRRCDLTVVDPLMAQFGLDFRAISSIIGEPNPDYIASVFERQSFNHLRIAELTGIIKYLKTHPQFISNPYLKVKGASHRWRIMLVVLYSRPRAYRFITGKKQDLVDSLTDAMNYARSAGGSRVQSSAATAAPSHPSWYITTRI